MVMYRRRRIWATVAILLVLALTATSCGPAKQGSGGAAGSGAAGGTGGVKEIKIGAVYPLSGSQATIGVNARKAMELAAEIINQKSDLPIPFASTEGIPSLGGAKLRLVWADHEGSPEKALSESERLITQEGVVAVLGSYATGTTVTASQAAERLQTPFLNPDSVGNSLTTRGFKWFFRLSPNVTMITQNFMDFMKEFSQEHGVSLGKMAVVYENTLWGQEVGPQVIGLAKQKGYDVAAQVAYAFKSTDVSSEVQKVKAVNPDVIVQGSAISDAILFMKAYKSQNIRPRMMIAEDYGFNDPSFVKTVGADANGILVRETWAPDIGAKKPLAKQVNDLFKTRNGLDMNGDSAREFTALFVLADALQRAGSLDKEAIRKALEATDLSGDKLIMPWDGIKFDSKTHQNVAAGAIITQIQDGVYYTVWPKSVASKQVVFPLPPWSQ